MVAPIFMQSEGFGLFSAPNIEEGQANGSAKVLTAIVGFDIAVTITSLVIGILGVTSFIRLSLPISYALIGTGGLFALSYVILMIKGMHIAKRDDERENGQRILISSGITDPFLMMPKVICPC